MPSTLNDPPKSPLDEAYDLAQDIATPEGRRIAALLSDVRHGDQPEAGGGRRALVLWIAMLAVSVAVLVSSLVGLYAYDHLNRPLAPPVAETALVREYYRGVYDMCGSVAVSIFGQDLESARADCREVVSAVKAQGWYEDESGGYAP